MISFAVQIDLASSWGCEALPEVQTMDHTC